MKTNPWFSMEKIDQDDKSAPVHHNNTSCTDGEGIGKNHRHYGTDNRPLCKRCARLNEAGR